MWIVSCCLCYALMSFALSYNKRYMNIQLSKTNFEIFYFQIISYIAKVKPEFAIYPWCYRRTQKIPVHFNWNVQGFLSSSLEMASLVRENFLPFWQISSQAVARDFSTRSPEDVDQAKGHHSHDGRLLNSPPTGYMLFSSYLIFHQYLPTPNQWGIFLKWIWYILESPLFKSKPIFD